MALDTTKEDTLQLIGFYVGQKLFGADILVVREILRNPSIAPADGDFPEFIKGILDVRGDSIPLVDLKQRMGGGQSADDSHGEWVIIGPAGDGIAAFAVDSVTRIFRLSKNEILPAPDLILSGLRSQYIRGVYNSEYGLLIVLDLDRILSVDEIKLLEKNSK